MNNENSNNKQHINESKSVNNQIQANTLSNTISNTEPKQESPIDIHIILEKIKNLSISNEDKSILMKQFKQNIMNPSHHENKDLEDIHKKYLGNIPKQLPDNNYVNQNILPIPYSASQYPIAYQSIQPNQQNYHQPTQCINPNYMSSTTPSNLMTTAHFEILKNKIDTVQFELIDLLRHVKDYTQRYMTSVRQQDLAKIDEYIKGLFDVDKQLKETSLKSNSETKELEKTNEETNEVNKEEPVTEQSLITKTTNGIKNFMGSIGTNVSGITGLVSSTADIANNYLSKKIITSPNDKKNQLPSNP